MCRAAVTFPRAQQSLGPGAKARRLETLPAPAGVPRPTTRCEPRDRPDERGLARTIHEPAACERDLPAARCVANPGRSSECAPHACVATGVRALRSAGISHSRLAVHELSGLGRLTRIAVIARTMVAAISSAVAERRRLLAPSSVPSCGRCRRQFQAPRAATPATMHRLTLSVMP